MNICYLADGQNVHTQKWVKYFARKSHDVHLLTFHKTSSIDDVTVHNLEYFPKIAYPLRIIEVRRAIKKIEPDVLHAHYISHYGIYGALTGFSPFVVSVWGSDVLVDPTKSIVKSYAVKCVLKQADLITVDSISALKTVAGLGADEKKVKLIVHGVDLRVFQPFENREKFRKDLHIRPSQHVVISTRALESIYDIDTLIRAIPCVLDDCPNTYFLIVGDGTLRCELEGLAHKLGVTENVRFVGLLRNDEVPKFLGVSDVYVSTSLSDTTSVSLLEAMACELPVVVTDLEGNREWIKDGKNGLVFPKGDFRTLAEKILLLLKDEDVRKRFGVFNKMMAEKEGDYEKEMYKMEKLYEELVEAYKV